MECLDVVDDATAEDASDTTARVPIAEVAFDLDAPPTAPQSDLSAWLNGFCTTDERGVLSCPDLAAQFGCQTISDTGVYAVWLDAAVPPLLCHRACVASNGTECNDQPGLVQHNAGLGGLVSDWLLVQDDGVPAAVRTPAEFVERYAPVDGEGKALSFVAFTVPLAFHKFWPSVQGQAPSDVSSWQTVVDEACVTASIEGTKVTPIDDGYRVSTFRGPDWNGCIYNGLALERMVVTVSRAGLVHVESPTPLCYGAVPCYD